MKVDAFDVATRVVGVFVKLDERAMALQIDGLVHGDESRRGPLTAD